MSNKQNKPKMSAADLVVKMRDEKGITFKYTDEIDAESYLANTNNYLRTSVYRKNFSKNKMGSDVGKYQNLDFAYLQELSTIDMHFRFIVSKMCLDIEHALKVRLLSDIENDVYEDGYSVVYSFLSSNKYIVDDIANKAKTPFVGDLILKYFTCVLSVDPSTGKKKHTITKFDDCPAWVLLELLSYGEFIKFYRYYYENNKSGLKMPISINLLHLIRSLRNGTAHNNCLLGNLNSGVSNPPREISQVVSTLKDITSDQRKRRLSTRPTLEFTTLVYVYSLIISEKIKRHRTEELLHFMNGRMIEKKAWFVDNDLIISNYRFACKIVNNFLQ